MVLPPHTCAMCVSEGELAQALGANQLTTMLKITSIPPGEAPTWVREQWVGLSLPLAQRSLEPHRFFTVGVLSRSSGRFRSLIALLAGKWRRESGYVVECIAAIEVLSTVSPDAANWWRVHTPHLIKKGQYFLFQEGVGHVQRTSPP
jgi:hypothetical protein